jgi:hypothetical protein
MATSACGNEVCRWGWNRRECEGESAAVVAAYNENRSDFLAIAMVKECEGLGEKMHRLESAASAP